MNHKSFDQVSSFKLVSFVFDDKLTFEESVRDVVSTYCCSTKDQAISFPIRDTFVLWYNN